MNTNDMGDGSLRSVISAADTSPDQSSTINFRQGVTGTITLGSALPTLSKNITINGSGSGSLTVARSATAPNFTIFSTALDTTGSIQGMKITGGNNPNGAGAIYNLGSLALIAVVLSSNSGAGGGAIYNGSGSLSLSACTLFLNTAQNFGGAIYNAAGTVNVLSASQLYNNNVTMGDGGAIYNAAPGQLSIRDGSQIYDNSATNGNGGGIWNAGQFTMQGGLIDGNMSGNLGGGVYSQGSTGSATLTSVSLTYNSATNKGGGFYLLQGSLTLNTCTVSNNTAPFGPCGAWKTGSTYTANGGTITDKVVQDP
jgi:hypothetical protein